MIDKLNLVSIISKYHLNGMVEAVRWDIKEQNLSIGFNSPSKEMIGNIEFTGFPLEDSTIALSNTTQLNKLVAITNGYVELSYRKQHNLITKLIISDNNYTLDYSLADLMLIPKAGGLQIEPEFSEIAKIDNESISAIVKAKGALADTDTVVIRYNPNDDSEDRIEMCFAGNIQHSNKVSFFIPDVNVSEKFKQLEKEEHPHYNSNMIKEIMYCNKDMVSGRMSISLEGIMKIEFEGENLKSTYYLVSKEK